MQVENYQKQNIDEESHVEEIWCYKNNKGVIILELIK